MVNRQKPVVRCHFRYLKPSISISRRRAASGFSLIEVLAAVFIAAIIFTAVFAGISRVFGLLNTTRENLRATQIIVSRLEGLHLEAWGNGTNQPTQLFNNSMVPATFTDYFYPLGLNGNTNNLGTVYSGTVTVSTNLSLSPSSSYSGSLALVTISVSWTDVSYGVTNQHTTAMSTYIAQNGIQNYVFTH
jgi:prepilin-type N-terminal cleavage/methylation domain-containing protein